MLCEVSTEVRACNWSLVLIHSFIHLFLFKVNHISDVRRDLVPNILLHCIVLYIFSYYEPVFSLKMAIYYRNMWLFITY